MLQHQDEQQLLTGDMACPNKANKQKNKLKTKIRKNQQLSHELLGRRPRCASRIYGKVAPIVIRCLGGGIKQLEEDIRDFLNEKERFTIVGKMQRNVLRESKFIV